MLANELDACNDDIHRLAGRRSRRPLPESCAGGMPATAPSRWPDVDVDDPCRVDGTPMPASSIRKPVALMSSVLPAEVLAPARLIDLDRPRLANA